MRERNCEESENVSAERAREHRQILGVHIEESPMNEQQLEKWEKLLYKHQVFEEEELDLGCATGMEHKIHLNSEVPIN